MEAIDKKGHEAVIYELNFFLAAACSGLKTKTKPIISWLMIWSFLRSDPKLTFPKQAYVVVSPQAMNGSFFVRFLVLMLTL
jgi:hypothetical protein